MVERAGRFVSSRGDGRTVAGGGGTDGPSERAIFGLPDGGRMGAAEVGSRGGGSRGAQGTRMGARSLSWWWARVVRQVLPDAIAAGGSSLKDFVDSTGKVVTDRFSIGPSVMRPFPVFVLKESHRTVAAAGQEFLLLSTVSTTDRVALPGCWLGKGKRMAWATGLCTLPTWQRKASASKSRRMAGGGPISSRRSSATVTGWRSRMRLMPA